ncbi:MAG: phosphatase PAP2 family protein [Halocynthiibacter sp.]
MTRRDSVLRWLYLTVGLTVLSIGIFAAFPRIDIAVSDAFFNRNDGFWGQGVFALQLIRRGIWLFSDGIALLSLGLLLLSIVRPRWQVIRARILLFMITVYVLGPGLLVNVILKGYSGRARPRQNIEFGGDRLYTPPLTIADQCASNCSFVSGETSAIAAIALVATLVFVPRLSGYWRYLTVTFAAAITLTSAILRVIFGAHFLSDTLFSILLTALVALPLYLIFGLHKMPDLADPEDR